MGLGCNVKKIQLSSKIGTLEVYYCCQGAHSIIISSCDKFSDVDYLEDGSTQEERNISSSIVCWLKLYFKSALDSSKMSLPSICPNVFSNKGNFTVKVWKTLMADVPAGTKISYGDLAKLCGNNAASRAVGSAMRNNPIPLLIPCHRVIRHDGTLGKFSCGENIKEWLLKHESA